MAGAFEQLNEAGLLAIGLTPQWVDVAEANYTDAPSSASDGVYLEASAKALIFLALREAPAYRTSRVVVTAGDTGTTYTTTIDGNAVATTPASAVLSAIAIEIRDDMNGTPAVAALVTAEIDADDTTGATVLIKGKAEADYSIDSVVAAGTGTSTFSADASSCNLRVFVTPGGIVKSGSVGNAGTWVAALDGYYSGIDYRGFVERFDVAGMDRIYCELTTIAGDGSDGASVDLQLGLMVGPAVVSS